MAFEHLEPWGELSQEMRFGKVCAALAGGSPADYFPSLEDPEERKRRKVREQVARFKAFSEAQQASVSRQSANQNID